MKSEDNELSAEKKVISVNEGEIGIVNDTVITLNPHSSNINLQVKKGDDANTVVMKLTLTFTTNDEIIIGKDGCTVEASSVGIFDVAKENFFTSGAINSISLTTGDQVGEVKFESKRGDIVLRTNAEKREHGGALI